MFTLFETILNMSFTAGIVILALLFMRLFLKKAPRKFCYLLWLVVAFRLVIPFSFESSISIFNLGGEMPTVEIPQVPEEAPEVSAPQVKPPVGDVNKPEVQPPAASAPEEQPGDVSRDTSIPTEQPPAVSMPEEEEPQIPDWVVPGVTLPGNPDTSLPVEDTKEETSLPNTAVPETEVSLPQAAAPAATPLEIAGTVAATLWLAGIAVMLAYGLISYGKLRKRLSNAILLEGNVYGSDRIDAPFALGVFKPRIYIPFGLSDSAKEYILAHERYHLKRLDHIVKPISFGILALHWFNPLCWIAFNRMSLDMELSCDEAVLSRYGNEAMKKEYTKTLLDFATNKKFPSPAPLSFSEGASAKTRIKNALYWKKPKLWLSVVALVLSLVILVACAGNAITSGGEESTPEGENGLIDFGDTPYQFTFTSNGDGTCAITDILTDFHYKDHYDLVIPAASPDGDKLVEVDLAVLQQFGTMNVPPVLPKETLESLVEQIKTSDVRSASGMDNEQIGKVFNAFYFRRPRKETPEAEDRSVVGLLEATIFIEEYQRLSGYLTEILGYTEEQCYEDAMKALDLEMDEETAELTEQIAVHFLYHGASNISKVILPAADVKVHQGFLGLSYVLADGTAVTPVYENPVTLEIVTAEEAQNVVPLDEDGNEVIAFTSSRPVKDFQILTIDMADSITAEPHPKADSTFHHKAFTESYKLLLGENIPTRGISFVGEDGETYQYAICYLDGKKGSYKLVPLEELAGADFEEFSLLVKRVSDSAASKKTVYLSYSMMSDYDYFSITPNQPMTNVQIYFFQAEDTHTTKGWWYEGAAASNVVVDPAASVVEFLPIAEGETIYVGAHSTTVTDTWGISFTDYQGNKRYFAVFPTLDGKRQVIEMELDQTRMQFLPNTCPELDYSMLEVARTISSNLMILKDPRGEADQQFVLVLKKSDGTYAEIHRAGEFFYTNICYNNSIVAFNNFTRESETEVYLYNVYANKKTKLDLSALPEEETVSFMTCWKEDLLFVSQLDHGSVVQGGELWAYDSGANEIVKIFAVSDPRLQITGIEFRNLKDEDGYSYTCCDIKTVLFDETYNFTEEKVYSFYSSALDRFLGTKYYNYGPYTLLPDDGMYARPAWEGEHHYYKEVTPDAAVTNNYAVYSGAELCKLTFCTFKAVKEDPAKGWLYQYAPTVSEYYLNPYNPLYVRGSASYSATDTWGFFANGRFYAMTEDPLNGNDRVVEITDQVIGPEVPDDLSTVFDDTTTYCDGYREVVYNSFTVVHIYDWDQYFVLDTAMNLDVTGDTALGFAKDNTGLEDYYYKPMVYLFEKGKAEPTKAVIDVPEVFEASYSYHPITEKMGYLMVFGIWEDDNGTEYLAQVLKTTDGGLTWTLVREGGYITGGTYHDPVYYSTFLTEDFGVVAFNCNFDIDLAGHVYYTTDGGVSWRCMTGLDNLPRDPDEEWDLQKITLENGVYTITINARYDQYIYFTSTDLENWEAVPQVVLSDATDEQIADTENYTHFYDPNVDGEYRNYNAHLLVQVFAPIESFRFEALTEDGLDYIRETLYETDLVPGQPVIIHTYINDVIPICGFSYLNENGVRVYSELSSSMK